jgi:hypothetical protein
METEGQAIAAQVGTVKETAVLGPRRKEGLCVLGALTAGSLVWHMPPLDGMTEQGTHFLATMIVAVTLWVLDVFEEYIVGLMLLLAWVVLDIVPTKSRSRGLRRILGFSPLAHSASLLRSVKQPCSSACRLVC